MNQTYFNGYAGRGPKGYLYNDDVIFEDVCETLMSDDRIDATRMEVSVDDGVVILRGQVHSRLMKKLAEDSVENLPGVVDVRNELRLTLE